MMHQKDQRSWAAAYHILFAGTAEGCMMAQKDLDQDDALLAILNGFANSVQSPALQVTGSLFIKRYGLLVAGALHGFIRNRDALDLSMERVKLVWKEPTLLFIAESGEEPACLYGVHEDRERRTKYFNHLFADQVAPMLRRVAQVTRIDEETLWGTISYSLAYWKQGWLNGDMSEPERRRIEEDFSELWNAYDLDRFPEKAVNPLTSTFRSVDNPWDQEKPVLVRSKCCLFYCLPGKKEGHCYTCPKISDERRLEKYAEAHGCSKKEMAVPVTQ